MASLLSVVGALTVGSVLMASGRRWGPWRTWGVTSAVIILLGVRGLARRASAYPQEQKAKAIRAPGALEVVGIDENKELRFFCLDDQVMGGRSASAITTSHSGFLSFVGVINTNGGGFASCRTLGDEAPLGIPREASALEITGTGDGREYKATLHTADSWAMRPVWGHDFLTEPRVRTTWRLPLADFVATKQGRPVKAQSKLDVASVTGLGLSLSLYTAKGLPNEHFGDGPFELTIERIAFV